MNFLFIWDFALVADDNKLKCFLKTEWINLDGE